MQHIHHPLFKIKLFQVKVAFAQQICQNEEANFKLFYMLLRMNNTWNRYKYVK